MTLTIKNTSIESLIPYARNSRSHSEAQVAQIAASIREFGFTNPVLIDEKSGIIAGHGRVLAARKLGLDEVPCIRLDHLTDSQRKAYIIADNKIALNSGWDFDVLSLELGELDAAGFNLELTGFVGDDLTETMFGKNFNLEPESSTKEIDTDEYIMGQKCPKCGFEYDAKT